MIDKWWNENKLEWYERAAKYSTFHQEITRIIESRIEKTDTILELGSGTGHVAELLYKDGYSIIALDKDQDAIRTARNRSGINIFRIEDYRETNVSSDIVLTLFFGRIWKEDNLTSLLSRTKKKLITIYSLHKGQNSNIEGRKSYSLEESLEYLKSLGYKANGEELSISFNQPLKNEEEAISFIKTSYPNCKLQEYLEYLEKSNIPEYPLLFKNQKRMVLLEIYKK